jgi:hypothetical protein
LHALRAWEQSPSREDDFFLFKYYNEATEEGTRRMVEISLSEAHIDKNKRVIMENATPLSL